MVIQWTYDLPSLLDAALQKRQALVDEKHTRAIRLFNGYTEGVPDLVVEVFGHTLVLSSHSSNMNAAGAVLSEAGTFYREKLPRLVCTIEKYRASPEEPLRKGKITFGKNPDTQVIENGIHYAVNLQLNQDASFYMDTRTLRQWITEHASGKTVLNTFAYTGSLGIAALGGGAVHVSQVDINRNYLGLAHDSRSLNGFDASRMKLMPVDFFVAVGSLKREHALFDMVIVDPPFFSTTERGRVNQAGESTRLINKVRPLITDGGYLVIVNNALFYSGREFMQELEALCAGGFLSIEEIIPVPEDVTGFSVSSPANFPADPAPFNHPTKIVVLKVKRKVL
jgi:23S rRNA (cytosine1962-C5)-methyltransferase